MELLHFRWAVSLRSVITGRNRRIGKSNRGLVGIDAEPLVLRHYRFKDREISNHMERGEEIRGSGDTENRHQHFIFHPSSLRLPLPSLFLSLPLCPLSSSCTGFGSGFVFFNSFSPSLFLSPSLSRLCCHGYNIIPTWSASVSPGWVRRDWWVSGQAGCTWQAAGASWERPPFDDSSEEGAFHTQALGVSS